MTKSYLSFISLILFILIVSCSSSEKEIRKAKKKARKEKKVGVQRDLDEIKEDGVLNVLTTYSSTSYFLYRGQPMGYEYEMLKRFTEHLGVELNMVISNDIDTMYQELHSGQVDLIAHGITITQRRKELVNFSEYLYLTRQVLVQKKPDNWRKLKWRAIEESLIHDAIELIGDTVSVRANSSYINRLANLSEELGGHIYVDTLAGDLSTDQIIKMVADGKIKYTVADDNIASINASYYPILNIEVPISFSQRIAWAMRKNTPHLEKALNDWIKMMKKETVYYVIYNKYFKNEKNFRRREQSEFLSLNNNKISRYDDLIIKYANELGWDWRLLAAQVYQESQFNPKATSWAGAHGLMQMMPETAKRLGVTNRSDPEQSLRGGVRYLQTMWDRFDEIPDSVQRIKFAMAAYNCGYSHVKDAQHLGTLEGVKADVWDDNIEEMILKLSYKEHYTKPGIHYGYVRGIEPITYVKQIFGRYEHYVQFVE